MAWHVVIPARYQSTRLPGKPLADIAGTPMIIRVAAQARKSGADSVIVATDDQRIMDVVVGAGYEATLTREDHRSGSERAHEVATQRNWQDSDLIVNVQGDEPLIPPGVINQIAEAFAEDESRQVVTLAEPMHSAQDVFDPAQVKVVFDASNRAQYFSRAPIPWDRDGFVALTEHSLPSAVPPDVYWRHIGIYGYRLGALARYLALPPSAYEQVESLEQLRFLHHNIPLHVFPAQEPVPPGIDTPEDLARINAQLASRA